jgi:hypothetical protein
MRAPAGGLLKPLSAGWAVAAAMLAVTGNGIAAQMTKLPAIDALIGHPCHDKYLITRQDQYAKMAILSGEIKALAFEFNEVGLPEGIKLVPPICERLRQINSAHDEILSGWYAERQCNNNASDQPIFESRIDDRLRRKAKTVSKLKQCTSP